MKKLFLILLLSPLFVAAENYFVEGARWTSYFGTFSTPETYSVEGTDFKAGYECHNLYRTTVYGKHLLTVIRVEGEKVYFLHDPYETEWDLLYDFGLEEGEECEVNWLYEPVYSLWPNYFIEHKSRESLKAKVVCTKKTTLPELGGATVLYIEDVDAKADSRELRTNRNYWVVGIGNPYTPSCNSQYHKYSVASPGVLTFDINGKEILRHNRADYCDESAFYPGVIWTSDLKGFVGDGRLYDEFQVTVGYYHPEFDLSKLTLFKPDRVNEMNEGLQMCEAAYIRLDGDQIYRIQGKKECPTGLAYDFGMQPGDVREVVGLETELGTPATWVKCVDRRASVTFPGREEIHLAEFADAACTEHIGDGIWVTGIGSIYGVLANSRFAETSVGSRLKKVSQYDRVIWDGVNLTLPAPAGIETVDAAADAPAVYYNLQGVRVDNPSGGVFIRVQGSKTAKVRL